MASLNLKESENEKVKFEAIYMKYRKLMFYVANKILHDEYLAEDAVHNAFLKISRHLDKFQDISCHKTKAFVVIVVENVSKDMYNSRKKNNTISFDNIEYEASDGNEFDENVVSTLEHNEIVNWIKEMPKIHRDVLMLRYIHEFSDKEIARIINVSESATRKRLERARQKLVKILKERGIDNV